MNILITGASGGIGSELVKLYAKNTNNTIVAISRDWEKLSELKRYCEVEFENNIHIYSVDFLAANFNDSLEVALQKQTHFDIVVNNAGYLLNKPFTRYSQQDIENTFKVNVFASIQVCQNVIALNKKKHCHIINIGSMGGFQGSVKFSGLSIYSASKAALASLTECLAEEYKDGNIKINCLALGSVQTEMLANAFPDYQAQLLPKQIAEYIVNFSQRGSEFFNGKIVPVSKTTP
jgi:short-subunit dehydrogenase